MKETRAENKEKNGKFRTLAKNFHEGTSRFHITANCYNGGRVHDFFSKKHCKMGNFTCQNGEISLDVCGVSRAEICEIMRKCGGENLQITPASRLQNFMKSLPILVGIVVFCLVIFLSNMFVLKVEVYGEDEILKVHIANIASEIYPVGAVKSDEKLAALKSEIAACDDVAFFTVETYQNTVIINFLKAENAEIITAKSSVIAPESGTLISLLTLSGKAVKAVGDTVVKGEDLIVASEIISDESAENGAENGAENMSKNGESAAENNSGQSDDAKSESGGGVTLKAAGSGVMEVVKTASFTLPQIASEKSYSGCVEEVVYYIVCGREIFNFESEFENFDVQSVSYSYVLPNVQMVKETRFEYFENTVIRTPAEAEEMAKEIFKSRYLQDFAYTITDIATEVEMEGEVFNIQVICKYLLQFS